MMEVTHSNLSRALDQDGFNLTLPQFARLVQLLEINQDQVYHILTGKRAKEAETALVARYARKIVEEIAVNKKG